MLKTPKQIKKSIDASRTKYRKRREKVKEFKSHIKSGVKFIHDNELENNIFDINLGPWRITFCYTECEYTSVKEFTFAYCIKSPYENYSYRIAKGLLGSRLENHDSNYTNSVIKNDIKGFKTTKTMIKNMIVGSFLATCDVFTIPHGLLKLLHTKPILLTCL